MPKQIITFNDKGASVALFDDGSTTVAGAATGSWATDSADSKNVLRYPVAGGAINSIALQYSMNAGNQLGLKIGTVAAAGLNGRILLEGHSGLLYRLVDDDGVDLRNATGDEIGFYVYGSVTIDPAKDTLAILDSAGATVTVTGEPSADGNMHSAVSAGPGDQDPGSSLIPDLLSFNAETTNKDSKGHTFGLTAELDLAGSWDLKNGKTVFTAKLSGGSGPTTVTVGLVGELRGVAYGFQFTEAGNKANVLFTIQGKIKGKNSTGGWDFTLGYSENHFSADLTVTSSPPTGQKGFTINGSLRVAGGGGAPLTIDLALEVSYVFNGGTLQVKVAGSGGVYSLAVSGKLAIGNGWNAEFAVSYSTAAGLQSFSLALGNAAPGSSLNKALSVFVSGTGTSLSVGLNLNLTFVGGQIVPDTTAKVPAIAAGG